MHCPSFYDDIRNNFKDKKIRFKFKCFDHGTQTGAVIFCTHLNHFQPHIVFKACKFRISQRVNRVEQRCSKKSIYPAYLFGLAHKALQNILNVFKCYLSLSRLCRLFLNAPALGNHAPLSAKNINH